MCTFMAAPGASPHSCEGQVSTNALDPPAVHICGVFRTSPVSFLISAAENPNSYWKWQEVNVPRVPSHVISDRRVHMWCELHVYMCYRAMIRL